MLKLHTERLYLRTLFASDWPLFLRLHSEPQTMQYVFGKIEEAQVRKGFDHRLPVWTPESDHWLCLVVVDKQSGVELGVSGFRIMSPGHAEVGCCCCRNIKAKASAPNPAGQSSTTLPPSASIHWNRP
ncbi:Acetyltransferase [Pseudomonas savastanoi pv. fraxini]|nr:Acetyltransferase [Pseudomonas savastanoi pv. fraxini]RMR71137.1 Acetyltransferase [Pseudomonas savastanoi pv. fraxini]